ncbi:MAG: FimV/HubP family polar landmark protein [Pseudomonadota bacterium]
MPRRLYRLSLALFLLLSGEVWALGLGEIQLESALNEPLVARIELLSATPDELQSLKVGLASADIFRRYDLDRPAYLTNIRFDVVPPSGQRGAYVRLSSTSPMAEPFLTLLVEASWSSGRLLREYTMLLDPPTYAPPQAQQPVVQAPERSTPADSGQIQRTPEPPAQRAPTPQPVPTPPRRSTSEPAATMSDPEPVPSTMADEQPGMQEPAAREPVVLDDTPGGSYRVERGDTLWGIASAMRPDTGLTMNQTMLALYEANPQAFGGNINNLRQGATLRLPSASEIGQIDRSGALAEVQRQHAAWGSPDYSVADTADEVGIDSDDSGQSLTLVPPDEDSVGIGVGGEDADAAPEPMSREQLIEQQIADIEATEVPTSPALLSLRNNELAALRQELAELRGEPYEAPVDTDADAVEDPFMAGDETDDATSPLTEDADPALDADAVDDAGIAAGDDAAVSETPVEPEPARPTRTVPAPEPSLVDQILGYVMSTVGMIIGGVLLLVIGVLVWFLRRGKGDGDDSWSAPLDSDSGETLISDAAMDLSNTESLQAPSRDDAIVVVEQSAGMAEDTIETPAGDLPPPVPTDMSDIGPLEAEEVGSIEDTFSSETAVNLDESDPIAEADFHMAYGLYDQAADLINGALKVEPHRTDLLTKLCETYFVWGNRDSFIDAAERLKQAVGGGDSAEWDKIVIMGQQIAADHALFAGAEVAAATKAVDLTFESSADDDGGALDMDFGGAGADSGAASADDDGVDFFFEDEADGGDSPTAEAPALDAETEETVEQIFGTEGGTAELPVMGDAGDGGGPSPDATAEIDLDDLGLDLSGLGDDDDTQGSSLDDDDLDDFGSAAATEIAPLDDEDDDLAATITEEQPDDLAATGRNPQIDPYDEHESDPDAETGVDVKIDDIELEPTSEMRLAADETGQAPQLNPADDESLLDATGATQVLPEDFDIQTIVGEDDVTAPSAIGDNDLTQQAPLDDDDATMLATDLDGDDEFDFAKTEALSPDAFAVDSDLDATGELPAVASTDMDLDLDNLTAALKVSELGDTMELPVDEPTVEQPRDDATIEQPNPGFGEEGTSFTQALSPDDMDDGLHEARTMTEVGTKLDLARAYLDMGDPSGARSILEEVLDEGDEGQRQQAQQLLDSLPS